MQYKNMKEAVFLTRPNRFIANIRINGEETICHVKNTGRCKELLLSGTKIIVQEADNPNRKTKYDLISVYKGENLINMDSQAPNPVFAEWVYSSEYFSQLSLLKAEQKYRNSRFDFYCECEGGKRRIFIETKGVTLEENGVAMFPDVPTQRGIKHLEELSQAVQDGYEAYVVFIIQMKGMKEFRSNDKTHIEFGNALRKAQKSGVHILALGCEVTKDSICAEDFVKINLEKCQK